MQVTTLREHARLARSWMGPRRTDEELLGRRQRELALLAEAGGVGLVSLHEVLVGRHVRVTLLLLGSVLVLALLSGRRRRRRSTLVF